MIAWLFHFGWVLQLLPELDLSVDLVLLSVPKSIMWIGLVFQNFVHHEYIVELKYIESKLYTGDFGHVGHTTRWRSRIFLNLFIQNTTRNFALQHKIKLLHLIASLSCSWKKKGLDAKIVLNEKFIDWTYKKNIYNQD